MPRRNRDPYRTHRFLLEITGMEQAGFSECILPEISTDVIEYREGNEPSGIRKLTGLTKYGNIVLKWGLTESMTLSDWYQSVIDGDIDRRDGTVIILNEIGEEAVRWDFVSGWPCKYIPSALNAKASEVAIETLEIAIEGLRRSSI